MANRIQVRRDTAANWTTANPVLAAGEPALETDTGRRKTGDGTAAWTALPYVFDKTIADGIYTTPAAANAAYAPITGSTNYLAPGQLDAANAANITTPTTATAGALNATIGKLSVLGPKWVFIGDSITWGGVANLSDGTQTGGAAWPTFAAKASNGRIRITRNAGVPGNITADMLTRFDTDVTPYNPDVVMIAGGVNDLAGGITQAVAVANLQALVQKVRNIGAVPVLASLYPMKSTALSITAAVWNTQLREWALSQKIPFVSFDMLADPATGMWPASWTSDLIHPTLSDGAARLGDRVISDIGNQLGTPTVNPPSFNNVGILQNGFFLTPGNPATPPSAVTLTPLTGTGTLPAGSYSYQVTARSYCGESKPSTISNVTLSATGQVTIAWGSFTPPSGSFFYGYRIYRQDNGGAWNLLAQTAGGTRSYVDDGSVTPVAANVPVTDTFSMPANWAFSGGSVGRAEIGVDAGARGNYLRINSLATTNLYAVQSSAMTVTPGQVWEYVGMSRSGTGGTKFTTTIQIRDASNTVIASYAVANQLLGSFGWGLDTMRFTIPALGVTATVVISNANDPSAYTDVAALDFRQLA